nr:hypothetical protein [Nakamurella antarctica]
MSNKDLKIEWRAPVSDGEVGELTRSHGGSPKAGWWDQVREHSLGWVTARTAADQLVGFVNVAWDGGGMRSSSTRGLDQPTDDKVSEWPSSPEQLKKQVRQDASGYSSISSRH